MSDILPPNIQELSRHYVDGRRFSSSEEVLVFAMDLFIEFERQYQSLLEANLRAAADAINAGTSVKLSGKQEIERYFRSKLDFRPLQSHPSETL